MSAMLDESAILPAADLGLTEDEREALIQTRALLNSEVIPHTLYADSPGFNMNYEALRTRCGAVCCIGGHMSLIIQGVEPVNGIFSVTRSQSQYAGLYVAGKDRKSRIGKLFWPNELRREHDIQWEEITPKMAVKAIDNFLTTGEPNWNQAVAA